ncbi:hypothetical protein SY212_11330 [Ligilactobacillus agilis]|uniref:Uncharacterized protein n=2 Tax=Ligilactobacillus agilis TaxID=1601 RepID=A0A6F9XLF0_9LACO|nr:hypothetical protein SY212_11330 [Ligilactobacillus agilis]
MINNISKQAITILSQDFSKLQNETGPNSQNIKKIYDWLCTQTNDLKLMQAIVDNYPNLTLKKIWTFIVSYYHPSNKINKQISGIVNTNNWTVVEITEDQVYQKIRNYYINFKKERNTNTNE